MIFTGGNYKLTSFTVTNSINVLISNDVSLWLPNGLSMSGTSRIDIAVGGKLRMYLGASSSIGAQAIVHNSGPASKCILYGLTACNSLSFSSTNTATACVYAPAANLSLAGGGVGSFDFEGAFVGKTATVNGRFRIHFDESLLGSGPFF